MLMTLTALSWADTSTPDGTVTTFYDWYQKADSQYRTEFSQAEPFLTPELYSLLRDGFSREPGPKFWVDFDPFVNAQIPAERFNVGKPRTVASDLALVEVAPYFNMGPGGSTAGPAPIKVYVRNEGGNWKIANMVYPGEHGFQLKQYLQEGLGTSAGAGASGNASPEDGMMSPEAGIAQGDSLAEALLGTWVHKATSKAASGAARPLDIAVIKWTFKPGGKCDFYQKVGGRKPMIATDRPYSLEGNTITLGASTKYTVVENSGNKMIWKNHRLGDFYHVVRE